MLSNKLPDCLSSFPPDLTTTTTFTFSTPCIEWEQTSNPAVDKVVKGFWLLSKDELLSQPLFTGLALASASAGGTNTIVGGDLTFWSLGAKIAASDPNTLAGPKTSEPSEIYTKSVELWVAHPTDTSKLDVDDYGNSAFYKVTLFSIFKKFPTW